MTATARPTSSAPDRGAAASEQAATTAHPRTAPLAGFAGTRRVPPPVNEPVKSYAPKSPERADVKSKLKEMAGERIDIPLVIGGKEVRTGDTAQSVMPHDHAHVLGDYHKATPRNVEQAIEAARVARADWGNWAWEDRAAVFLRAAELLTTTWRSTLNASTMLGQSKTIFQAEIDSACELIDFWRLNAMFAQGIYDTQPISTPDASNQLDFRPLEGFVYAITPFNFTAIAGNLPTAPALMGNTVVWKPASSAMLSAHYIMALLEEAGLPPGVINLVAGDARMISDALLSDSDLAGVHFTGSTDVFNGMWKTIGANAGQYRSYPRIVGETGGKDFIVAHPSADAAALAVAIVRGGFEYQGQKCSAVSRVYIPESLWKDVRDKAVGMIEDIRMGDVADFRNFMGAVIDERAFARISTYLERNADHDVLAGGKARGDTGWFIEPTLIQASKPDSRLLCEEIFGPVVTAYVYPDSRWSETLDLVNGTSPYALTGAVFARDREAVAEAAMRLRNAAGNFYVNDKPTGAVVGQQPFGGGRASGTNDKAGSMLNLVRWVSARAVKETFSPPHDYRYPFMNEE
ncbi:MAG TPA: L-glutamate gamma-semialdehyde dehydrogenase [Gemmatimonadaceae bacterium]|nr:L-glutamate gamma-semialdehyde dehydrogenase [Gemmatimonadaceae bacterium]